MTPAGYSGTPLARKLGIREGHRVATFGAPAHFADLLDLPAGVEVEADPPSPDDAARSHDVLVCFAPVAAELAPRFARARGLLAWDGGLWVAWPKRASPLATDVRESDVRSHGLAQGLVDNKICAIDDDWSGLRFVHRREDRPRPGRS